MHFHLDQMCFLVLKGATISKFVIRFMHSLSHFHFAATKRVLRYIQGTKTYEIRYCRNSMVKLFGFCDNYESGYIDDTKSTLGYAFSLGSNVFSCPQRSNN
jgi:hypothetical protein